MNPKIAEVLDKNKIQIEDLDDEEKATYDTWSEILSNEFTLEKLKDFCVAQKGRIEKQYTNLDNSRDKDFVLKATLSVYMAIIGIIEGDKAEKVALIQRIEELIK